MQHAPYASSLALESLELAMAIAAFDQEVSLLFKNAGILQLLKHPEPNPLQHKAFTNAYSAINLFGITNVYVCQTSLYEYKNAELIMQPLIVSDLQISELLTSHDIVLNL